MKNFSDNQVVSAFYREVYNGEPHKKGDAVLVITQQQLVSAFRYLAGVQHNAHDAFQPEPPKNLGGISGQKQREELDAAWAEFKR